MTQNPTANACPTSDYFVSIMDLVIIPFLKAIAGYQK
jgi:hypothetical protein